MKRVLSIFVVVFLACYFCAGVNAATTEKEWTFMVFLNADNNLDSFGADDLKDMVTGGGSNEYRNIICLIDREHGPANLYYITKDKAELIKEMGELDMGDYREFVRFVADTAKAYPAKQYCAVVWNHGSGWKDINGDIIKGISYDDSSGNHITTNQLTTALDEITKIIGKKLDVFCFDACLMQMIEVAYAMKDGCDYLVASEETEPGYGYPFIEILSNFKKGMNPTELCKMIVREYAASYNNGSAGSSSTTQSALKCSEIDNLCDAINGYAKAAMFGDYAIEFKNALNRVQKFYYRTNIDLGHFVDITRADIKDTGFQTAANKLKAAYKKTVITNGISGYNTKNSTGIAVYFPTSSYSFSSDYKDLAFAKNTLWEAMVKDYYKKMTTKKVLSQASDGNVSALSEYVATANKNNREVSYELISRLNFHAFVENNVDEATKINIGTLVSELKEK